MTNLAILIVCPLSRVAGPLSVIVPKLFDLKDVRVISLDPTRGWAALIVHVLRHRRFTPVADQYRGIQSDLKRECVAYTRGRLKTMVWLEQEPFGTPRSPLAVSEVYLQGIKEKTAIVEVACRRNELLSSTRGFG